MERMRLSKCPHLTESLQLPLFIVFLVFFCFVFVFLYFKCLFQDGLKDQHCSLVRHTGQGERRLTVVRKDNRIQ